ncbi:MAG: mechanosensitive ion channel, partial [Xanthomonadaceae bacterium]|nr:mechanosensitive ion channel [Xanthomonadaceae bacterium]
NIDTASVHFATEDDLARLRQARLLSDYIENKLAELKRDNEQLGVDPDSPINARKLTNLGIFRAYLTAYLGASEHINHDLTYMVRHLPSGAQGIPLEIYGFCNQTSWVPYENIQSDIFDHIFAVIPEFGLRLHQSPGGYDVAQLGMAMTTQRAQSPEADGSSQSAA